MEKPLKVRLHIISPVHIGCDDVYEPTSFKIDEENKKLIAFDPMDFIKSLSPQYRQEFTKICMKGNISSIVEIYRFISDKQVNGREVEICNDFLSHYREVLNLRGEVEIRRKLSQFEISRTAYNPHNNLPYIPGSSLKGSLRTAYLSKLAKDNKVKGYKGKADALEKQLLGGSFATDPFRMVKVSDFLPVGDVKTKIVYAVNKKKKASKFEARGPFQIVETLKEGAVFEGIINIQQPLSLPEKPPTIKEPIKIKDLLKAIDDFYWTINTEEENVTEEIGAKTVNDSKVNDRFKDHWGASAFLIRIGRHSGAEAATIEGNRNIKIKQAEGQPPKYLDSATTIWLASETRKPTSNNGLIPFGWAVMEVI
ncbi:MAG TPA: type III-A CRISPR-associated RAMP protein Csm5 [Candidatus Brocadiia bacterium]|nr:type III-A CRISPR-associated RAMP protein Csm5 [Candidatus Brocadiales bacterium]